MVESMLEFHMQRIGLVIKKVHCKLDENWFIRNYITISLQQNNVHLIKGELQNYLQQIQILETFTVQLVNKIEQIFGIKGEIKQMDKQIFSDDVKTYSEGKLIPSHIKDIIRIMQFQVSRQNVKEIIYSIFPQEQQLSNLQFLKQDTSQDSGIMQKMFTLIGALVIRLNQHLYKQQEYQALEEQLQKVQKANRGYNKLQQQMKMYIEFLENKLEVLIKENSNLMRRLSDIERERMKSRSKQKQHVSQQRNQAQQNEQLKRRQKIYTRERITLVRNNFQLTMSLQNKIAQIIKLKRALKDNVYQKGLLMDQLEYLKLKGQQLYKYQLGQQEFDPKFNSLTKQNTETEINEKNVTENERVQQNKGSFIGIDQVSIKSFRTFLSRNTLVNKKLNPQIYDMLQKRNFDKYKNHNSIDGVKKVGRKEYFSQKEYAV